MTKAVRVRFGWYEIGIERDYAARTIRVCLIPFVLVIISEQLLHTIYTRFQEPDRGFGLNISAVDQATPSLKRIQEILRRAHAAHLKNQEAAK